MKSMHMALLLVASLVLLGNCQVGPTQPPETGPEIDSATVSPGPDDATVEDSPLLSPLSTPGSASGGTAFESPLPTPIEEPGEVPTPASQDVGVVTGLILGGEPPEPALGLILRLANVLEDSDGTPLSASLDKQTAPTTLVSGSGQYIFTDVPPGRYALIVDLITSSVVLRDPVSGSDLLADVAGGEIVDLGELVYPDLPLLAP